MSETKSSLKQQNTGKLRTFIAANTAVFWAVFSYGTFEVSAAGEIVEQLISPQGLAALVLPLLTIVLNGVLSPQQKALVVYWRKRNPLPGSRAFSRHAKEDARVDRNILEQRLGELPDDPSAQNALWYQLLQAHQTESSVEDAHRQSLLTRDMAGLSFIFFIIFTAFLTLFGRTNLATEVGYGVMLLLQYLIVRVAARNYGESLVRNVLAQESAQ